MHSVGMSDTIILPKSDHVRDVGIRLRQLIDALDIPYKQAAQEMGVSKSHLGNWMRGTNYPTPYEVFRFCRRRGVNFDWIFLGDPAALPHRVVERLLAGVFPQETPAGEGSQAFEKTS